MRKIVSFFGAVAPLLLVFNAAAENCPVLEFQELKDMNKKELVQEYCRAVKTASVNIGAALDAVQAGGNHKRPTEEAGQCQDQAKRISRILEKKGVKPKEYEAFCKDVP
jgi:hypothetical protein